MDELDAKEQAEEVLMFWDDTRKTYVYRTMSEAMALLEQNKPRKATTPTVGASPYSPYSYEVSKHPKTAKKGSDVLRTALDGMAKKNNTQQWKGTT